MLTKIYRVFWLYPLALLMGLCLLLAGLLAFLGRGKRGLEIFVGHLR